MPHDDDDFPLQDPLDARFVQQLMGMLKELGDDTDDYELRDVQESARSDSQFIVVLKAQGCEAPRCTSPRCYRVTVTEDGSP